MKKLIRVERSRTIRTPHSPGFLSHFLGLLVGCAIVTGVMPAQGNQDRPEATSQAVVKGDIADALDRLAKGVPFLADFQRLARVGAVEAVPELKKRFSIVEDEKEKDAIASALVRLGEKNGAYWDFLMKEALAAVENDAPSQLGFDANGRIVPRASPEFLAWAKTRNLSPDSAIEVAMFGLPGKVLLLVETTDVRAIPLLRKALLSHNFIVQSFAAGGLSKLNDRPSIPLIIEICQRAPAEIAFAISQSSLIYFNDQAAQNAAKAFAAANPKSRPPT